MKLRFGTDLHFDNSITPKEQATIRHFFADRQLLASDGTVTDVYRFAEEPDSIHLSVEAMQARKPLKRRKNRPQHQTVKKALARLPLAKEVVRMGDFTAMPLPQALADLIDELIRIGRSPS